MENQSFDKIKSWHNRGLRSYAGANFKTAKNYYQKGIEQALALINQTVTDKDLTGYDKLLCDIYLDMCQIYIKQDRYPQALDYIDKSTDIATQLQDEIRIARCLDKQGEIKMIKNQYDQALINFESSLKIKLKVLDSDSHDHLDVADSYYFLSIIYCIQGQFEKSYSNCHQALDIRKRLLGPTDIKVIQSYLVEANILQSQAKWNEAITILDNCLFTKLPTLINKDNHFLTATVYNNIGAAYYFLSKYKEALSLHQKALKIQLQLFDENHSDIALSRYNMGNIFRKQSKYDQAMSMFQNSLKISLKLFGDYHFYVAESYCGIGHVYKAQFKNDQFLPMFQKSLNIMSHLFGDNHFRVARSYYTLGIAYKAQFNYDQALSMYKKSLTIVLQVFGNNHPLVAAIYDRIGVVYHHQSKYDQALDELNESLKIRLNLFGDTHSTVATTHYHIARTYCYHHKYDEALLMHQKSLTIRIKLFGEAHIDVANSYDGIGITYLFQNKHNLAVSMHDKSLRIRLNEFGDNHIDVAASYNNLGNCYIRQFKYNEALQMYQKSLKIRQKLFGENHPEVAASYSNIGNVYSHQSINAKAQIVLKKSLTIRLKLFNEDNADVATSYNNIGNVYREQFNTNEALEMLEKSLKIRLKLFGEHHADVAKSYANLGNVYSKNLSNYDLAISMYGKALNIQLSIFGECHNDVASSYSNLGNIYYYQYKYASALPLYEKALKIRCNIFEDHCNITTSYNHIGNIYAKQSKYTDALSMYQKSLKYFKKSHFHTANSYDKIGNVYYYQSEYKQALSMYQKSLNIRLDLFNQNHPDVATSYNNIAKIYTYQSMFDEALSMYNLSLKIRSHLFNNNHPDIAASYHHMGKMYKRQSKYDQAMKNYEIALHVYVNLFGENFHKLSKIYVDIANIYHEQGKHDQVASMLQKSNDIITKQRESNKKYEEVISQLLQSDNSCQDIPQHQIDEDNDASKSKHLQDQNEDDNGVNNTTAINNDMQRQERENEAECSSDTINQNTHTTEINDSQKLYQLYPGMIPAVNGYPHVTKLCKSDDDQVIKVVEVPGLQLTIPQQCLTDDVSITLTVYYWDPPYNRGLQLQDEDKHLIYLSPIVRLEPDDYQFNYQQSFNAVLQLPIPSTDQLCQHFSITNMQDLNLQLAQRQQSDSQWHVKDIADQSAVSITKINDIYCVLIPLNHFSDYVVFIKSIYSRIKDYIFPSYQQEVSVLAYLSKIDRKRKITSLTVLLIRRDVDRKKIEQRIRKEFRDKSLSCSGLEGSIFENGSYEIKFDNCGLACKNLEFKEQEREIDWNELSHYWLHFNCIILDSIDQLVAVANIIIKPIGNQNNRNSKSISIIMPESTNLQPIESINTNISNNDLRKYFFLIANAIGTDWTKLAARLDPSIDIDVIMANKIQNFDRAMEFLKKFYNKHQLVASLDQFKKALKDIGQQSIVNSLENFNAS